jgi:hypothetical protein
MSIERVLPLIGGISMRVTVTWVVSPGTTGKTVAVGAGACVAAVLGEGTGSDVGVFSGGDVAGGAVVGGTLVGATTGAVVGAAVEAGLQLAKAKAATQAKTLHNNA